MKSEERAIQKALDHRLSFLEATPQRRARIKQRIDQEEEPAVRRKITTGLIAAIITILVLSSVALAVGMNLFAHFGQQDERYDQIAPQTVLETEAPVTVESSALGSTTATINSAYYDGKSLIVGYIMENTSRLELFTPTEEQLSGMEKMTYRPMIITDGEEDAKLFAQFNQAVEQGVPLGIASYSIYPSDHTETDGGIDLPPATEFDESGSDGVRYIMREYETPLPVEAQDQESLNIRIQLYQNVSYFYFDGKAFYGSSEDRKEVGAMTATARRADAQTLDFAGRGKFNAADITVKANVSTVWVDLVITAQTDAFPQLENEDSWYEVIVFDDKGTRLQTAGVDVRDPGTLKVSCKGSGILPEALHAYLVVATEGEGNQPDLSKLTPIILAQ